MKKIFIINFLLSLLINSAFAQEPLEQKPQIDSSTNNYKEQASQKKQDAQNRIQQRKAEMQKRREEREQKRAEARERRQENREERRDERRENRQENRQENREERRENRQDSNRIPANNIKIKRLQILKERKVAVLIDPLQ
jgi:hypothetical protein